MTDPTPCIHKTTNNPTGIDRPRDGVISESMIKSLRTIFEKETAYEHMISDQPFVSSGEVASELKQIRLLLETLVEKVRLR